MEGSEKGMWGEKGEMGGGNVAPPICRANNPENENLEFY